MNDLDILKAIPCTEPATFSEFLSELDDSPERGDKAAWASLFRHLERLERSGFAKIERTDGRVASLILTEWGAGCVRSGKMPEGKPKRAAQPKTKRIQPLLDEGDIDLSSVPESDVPW